MANDSQPGDDFLEIVGDLKDRLYELEQEKLDRATTRRLAPETQPDRPWSPCSPEEMRFYGSLTELA